jgi:hypothetical protein
MDAHPAQLIPKLAAAQNYIKGRTWDDAAQIVAKAINNAIDEKGTRITDGEKTAAKSPFHLEPA